MQDMILRVKCPCCLLDDGEANTGDTLMLLGDDEQNMQCLGCGFGSNNNMKSDEYNANEFQSVCRKLKDRWWAPSSFTTEHYTVIPFIDDGLKWKIIPLSDTTTEVIVPSFVDAFKMIEKLENLIGDQIQQSENN